METTVKRPQVIITAVITRADGTIEDLGVISKDAEIKESKGDENNG